MNRLALSSLLTFMDIPGIPACDSQPCLHTSADSSDPGQKSHVWHISEQTCVHLWSSLNFPILSLTPDFIVSLLILLRNGDLGYKLSNFISLIIPWKFECEEVIPHNEGSQKPWVLLVTLRTWTNLFSSLLRRLVNCGLSGVLPLSPQAIFQHCPTSTSICF